MDHKTKNRWYSVIAAVLAVIVGCSTVMAGVASFICYRTGMYNDQSKQQVLSSVYSNVQRYYEMKIARGAKENKENCELAGTNLTYSIKEVAQDADPSDDDGNVYVIGRNTLFNYKNSGVVWNLLHENWYVNNNGSEYHATVTDLVYNQMNGVFYYSVRGEYYFPVKSISIASGYTMIGADGKKVQGNWTNTFDYNKSKHQYVCAAKNLNKANGKATTDDSVADKDVLYTLETSDYKNWVDAEFDRAPVFLNSIVAMQLSSDQPRTLDGMLNYSLQYDPDYYDFQSYCTEEEYKKYAILFIKGDPDTVDPDELQYSKSIRNGKNGDKILVFNIPVAIDATYDNTGEGLHTWQIKSTLPAKLDRSKSDMFVRTTAVIDALYPIQLPLLVGTILGALLFAVLVVVFGVQVYRSRPSGSTPGILERIPLLFVWAVLGTALGISLSIFGELYYAWQGATLRIFNAFFALGMITVVVGIAIGLFVVGNFAKRLRTGTLLRYTACHYIVSWVKCIYRKIGHLGGQVCRAVQKHVSLFVRVGAVWLVISFLQLIVLLAGGCSNSAIGLFFLYKIVEALFVLFCTMQFQKLHDGSRKLAEGELSQKLDTKRLYGPFRALAEYLNQINEGIQIAVQEKLQSERFKTELITNVSHDIKTPLTSIINYVDLLQRPETTEDERAQYIEVLQRQSAKLKKLIEDLIEASKASTGNLSVFLEDCNLGILLTQAVGEFSEKLEQNQLELIIRSKLQDVIVQADNRHIWRIFDNLINNICKYAQPGTRVYVDLEVGEDTVAIMFRNTSKYQLEMDGEEMLERFVRGDRSRNTEGNGLGLSIAKNLAELMNGSLQIVTDGDLFKAIVRLPIK